ncbi:hypothetical protein MHI18_21530 [Peribacillus sp. FSL H8-0477]|uniref:hypothetical protein n=1 Tax=Peribacillus sp. FSL H8-0477 TaxID=2921388 RepID=UPI0030F4F982
MEYLVGHKINPITVIHDMDFVAEAFERTIVLAHRKVLLDGGTREIILQKDILVQAGLNLAREVSV